jgi:hypothetical protein
VLRPSGQEKRISDRPTRAIRPPSAPLLRPRHGGHAAALATVLLGLYVIRFERREVRRWRWAPLTARRPKRGLASPACLAPATFQRKVYLDCLRGRQPMARTFLSIFLVCAFATASAAQHPSRGGQSHACDHSGTTLFFADTLPPIQVSPLPGCSWPGNQRITNRYSPRNRRRVDFVGANHRG